MDEITRLRRPLAVVGLLIAVLVCVASADASASATFSPAARVSPAGVMPRSVAFSSTGDYLAVADTSGPLSRYAIRQGGALEPLVPSSACAGSSVAFKPGASVLASADSAASTVTLCSVSRTDGSVTPLGSPMPTGTTPTSVQFSPDGRFLATTDVNAGTISMFSVGATGLAPVNDGQGFLVDSFVTTPGMSATFSPDGRFLVVTISSCFTTPAIAVYAVAADGSLSQVDALNLPVLECAADTTFIGTSNEFIADVIDPTQSDLVTYALSPTGQLTETNGTISTGVAAVAVAVSPDGKLITYADYQDRTVALLARASDGTLTPVTTITPGDGPSSVAFSADGTMLGVTTENDDSVELYHLAPGPALLPAGAPTPLDGISSSLAVSSNELVAVSTQGQDGVELFALSGAGLLTPTAALGPADVTTPHGVAFNPDGNLLAVASDDGLRTYTVSAGGVPTHAGSASTGDTPYAAAFSPDGSLVATANYYANSVSLFSIAPDGTPTLVDTAVTGAGPRSLAFSPDGSLLLTADESEGDISVFGVSGATLIPKRQIVTGPNPEAVAFRPSGGQFAVVDYTDQDLATYAIDAEGQATLLDRASVPTAARVAYSPSGDMLAAVDEATDPSKPSELWAFSVSDSGAMTPFGDPTVIDVNPYGLAFDPSGRFMLIPQILDRDVWVYPLAAPVLDTVIKTGPAAFDNQAAPTFSFDASYPSTYECKLDGGPFAACDRSPAIPVAGEGPHTLSVRARDAVGNLDPTPATYSWTYDSTPPSAPAPSTPDDGATNLPSETSLSWAPSQDALSGVGSYQLLVDGTPRATVEPFTCATVCTASVSGLADGAHTWQVRAVDVAGNTSESATRTFSVDAIAPSMLSLLAPTSGAVVSTARPTLSWLAAIDIGSGLDHYEITVDGQALQPTPGTSIQVPNTLPDGNHTWSVVAVDRVGNRSAPVSASFRTDTTPPIARLIAGPRQTRPGIGVTLDASASTDPGGAIADYRWDTNGDGALDRDTGTNAVTTTTFSIAGTYRLTVQVTDQAGLTNSASFDVTITSAPPNALGQGAGVRFIPPKATSSRLIRLVLTPPAGAVAARISNNDDPNQPGIKRVLFDGPGSVTTDWLLDPQTSPGKETKQVFVWFERGTELIHTSPTIVLDEQAPKLSSATLTIPRPRIGAHRRDATLRVKASDRRGTGITKIHIGPRCTGSFKAVKAKAKHGVYTFSVRPPRTPLRVSVRDAVGNTSACVTARKRG